MQQVNAERQCWAGTGCGWHALPQALDVGPLERRIQAEGGNLPVLLYLKPFDTYHDAFPLNGAHFINPVAAGVRSVYSKAAFSQNWRTPIPDSHRVLF